MGRILFGIILGIVLVPLALLTWLHFGQVPVAVDDPKLPQERLITEVPLEARIQRELIKNPPIQAIEANFTAGAQIYADQCAACHGLYSKPSSFGEHMFPDAPPLWQKHHNSDVVGVSDDPPGETYWKVKNGIRLTGMPSYQKVLTDTEMWQVSLLLANADKQLPPNALYILRGNPPVPPTTPTTATPLAPPATPAPGAPLPPL